MLVVEPVWRFAFTKETNEKGWRDMGLCPFTRCVFHELKAKQERREKLSSEADIIDYRRLSLMSFQSTGDERALRM